MTFFSWILGYVLYWSSFTPLVVRRRVQNWKRRTESIISALDQTELCEKLADVTLELHAVSRNVYLSLEKYVKRHRGTALFWERHLKFPINSAIWYLKRFSEDLQFRVEDNRRRSEWEIVADVKKLVRSVTSQGRRRSSRRFRDLSSEIQLLGDSPAAQGVASSIWLGELRSGSQVAVKVFIPYRTSSMQKDFIREASVWFHASHHENVLPLLGIARVRDSLALISPWMPERDMGAYLSTHPDANRLELLADVARGLAYLHSQDIVYGNLRSSTVVVSDMGRAYLSSFLIAHSQKSDHHAPTNILRVNWRFITPELVMPAEHSMNSAAGSDVFMYGTIAMEVFTNNTSYMRASIRNLVEGKLPKRPHALDHLGFSDDLWLLVNSCWHKDPAQRPTMFEVARRVVQLSVAFTAGSPDAIQRTNSQRELRDISAEIKRLGEHPIAGGGYCDLYLGERLGTEKVALKLVRLIGSTAQDKDTARRRFVNEACLWAEFQHPRILEFYGICEYGTMSLYMVSPWLENGNVHAYLTNINPSADRYRLLRETAEGLLYLHSREPPVIHGDLKAANILVTGAGTAVLADFGLSKLSHEATATVLQGAGFPRWMAPELVLAGDDVTGPLKTQKTDVYAYGHVMLEVLSDQKPFFNLKEDLHVIVQLIHGGRSPRPDGPVAERWLDDASWTISRQCTALDQEDRPQMDVLLPELERVYSVEYVV